MTDNVNLTNHNKDASINTQNIGLSAQPIAFVIQAVDQQYVVAKDEYILPDDPPLDMQSIDSGFQTPQQLQIMNSIPIATYVNLETQSTVTNDPAELAIVEKRITPKPIRLQNDNKCLIEDIMERSLEKKKELERLRQKRYRDRNRQFEKERHKNYRQRMKALRGLQNQPQADGKVSKNIDSSDKERHKIYREKNRELERQRHKEYRLRKKSSQSTTTNSTNELTSLMDDSEQSSMESNYADDMFFEVEEKIIKDEDSI